MQESSAGGRLTGASSNGSLRNVGLQFLLAKR
jgi:hypothetical protein